MRITGGQIRGRRLHTPRGLLVRPTSDRVREAVFNILGQRLPGLNVLDIFSGTGSFGIEALSRGAVSAIFIDRLRQAIDLIRKNIDSCGYGDRGTILRWDLTKGVPWGHPLLRKRRLDLVFVDPPYSRNLAIPALTGISQGKGLNAGARVVVESAKGSDLPPAFSSLQKVDARIYGDTEITIYEFRD